jgi:hypothetical protein
MALCISGFYQNDIQQKCSVATKSLMMNVVALLSVLQEQLKQKATYRNDI